MKMRTGEYRKEKDRYLSRVEIQEKKRIAVDRMTNQVSLGCGAEVTTPTEHGNGRKGTMPNQA